MNKLIQLVLALSGAGSSGFLTKYLWDNGYFEKSKTSQKLEKERESYSLESLSQRSKKEQQFNSGFSAEKNLDSNLVQQISSEEIGNLVERQEIDEINDSRRKFYQSHNFEVKNWNSSKSEIIEQKIRDYTVGLIHSCSLGTGWILDYEWPENEKYPTRWFIATNAHVFERFDFTGENIFGQTLSQPCKGKRTSSASFQLGILKEKVNKDNSISVEKVGVQSAKLFYAARNHLKENPSSMGNRDYFHDFIVLEVIFSDQWDARNATDNFHDKYGKDGKKPLNLFHKGITEKENNFFEEKTYTTPYYVGGFPAQEKGKQKNMIFNHKIGHEDSKAATLNQLTLNYDSNRLNEGKRSLRGLGDTSFKLKWERNSSNKQDLTGFLYWINKANIGAGGSGSLVVDEDENLLGLYSFNWGGDLGGVQPIRSYNLELSRGRKSPKFDLIRGSEEQTSSYKSQLDRYFKDKKTFLRVKQSEQFNSSF